MNSTEHSSFIHNLQIASPCKMDWDKMTGDERKRFCGACKLHVYNIAAMTLPEAEQLIIDSEGKVCLQLYRRKDGTVITKDCPVGLAARLRRRVAKSVAMTVTALSVLAAWALNYRGNGAPSLWEQWRGATQPEILMGGGSDQIVRGRMTMGEVVSMPIKPAPSPEGKQHVPLTH